MIILSDFIDTAQTSFQWFFDLLNTKLFVYGGTTITALSFIGMMIKWFVPRNKQLRVLECEKKTHIEEIEQLKLRISELENSVKTLTNEVDVLIQANSYNSKVKKLKAKKNTQNIKIENPEKKIKVKVIKNEK